MRGEYWDPATPVRLRLNNGVLEMLWVQSKNWGVHQWRPVPSVTDGKPDDRPETAAGET